MITGEITFDTEVSESGKNHIEGCYRLSGEDWRVYYITNRYKGSPWTGEPIITASAVWRSGVSGVNAIFPINETMNKAFVQQKLSYILGVDSWNEVPGPDSLSLK